VALPGPLQPGRVRVTSSLVEETGGPGGGQGQPEAEHGRPLVDLGFVAELPGGDNRLASCWGEAPARGRPAAWGKAAILALGQAASTAAAMASSRPSVPLPSTQRLAFAGGEVGEAFGGGRLPGSGRPDQQRGQPQLAGRGHDSAPTAPRGQPRGRVEGDPEGIRGDRPG
jgi:hypothetical protein